MKLNLLLRAVVTLTIFICQVDLLKADAISSRLSLMTDTYIPYSYRVDGEAKGVNVDVVNEVMRRLKITHPIDFLPWKRGMKILRKKPRTALFPVIYTEERGKTLKFACSLDADTIFFYTLKSNVFDSKSRNDLRKLRVGYLNGNASEKYLKEEGFTNITALSTEEQVYAMLHKGRIDLIPLGEKNVNDARNSQHKSELLKNTGIKLFETKYCIAFSKDVPDREALQWEKALEEIVIDGTLLRIKLKYKSGFVEKN